MYISLVLTKKNIYQFKTKNTSSQSIENAFHVCFRSALHGLFYFKVIAKHMQWGRQEDAHEFLRYVIEAAQKTCLNGYAK